MLVDEALGLRVDFFDCRNEPLGHFSSAAAASKQSRWRGVTLT
jgi:hypothetical protein